MHNCQLENVLVIAASLLNSLVQRGSTHLCIITGIAGNIVHMGFQEVSRRLCRNARSIRFHAEHAFKNGKQHCLFHFHLVIADLCGNIVHEVNTRRNVLAEAAFSPRIHTGSHHKALFIGCGVGCGNIGVTVIVLRSAAADTPKVRHTGIKRTRLCSQSVSCVLIAANRTRFCKFGFGSVRNPGYIMPESLWIECFRIKLCHCLITFLLNQFLHPGLPPCKPQVPNRSFWKCQLPFPASLHRKPPAGSL